MKNVFIGIFIFITFCRTQYLPVATKEKYLHYYVIIEVGSYHTISSVIFLT